MARNTRIPEWAQNYVPWCEGLAALLHPLGEVVLHDLERDRIIAIWNPFSRRAPGDPSLIAELPEHNVDAVVVGPYEKVAADGSRVTSVTLIVRDRQGAPRGLLCVNLNRAPLDGTIELLASFGVATAPRPEPLFKRDWREQIAIEVDDFCRSRNVDRRLLDREQRLELVTILDKNGLFATRNAVPLAARALQVSKSTIYSDLKEARA